MKRASLTAKSGFVLIVIGLAVYCYALLKNNPSDPVLASLGDAKYRQTDLDPAVREKLKDLEYRRYELLANSARQWLDNLVLAKEAAAQSMDLSSYLQSNLGQPMVNEEEAYRIYAQSPAATQMPYHQALQQIREALRVDALNTKKETLLVPLRAKYGARLHLPSPPADHEELRSGEALRRFAPFKPKPAAAEIADGKVVAPASQGAAAAPVLLEVFSDFMCPFSGQFSQTLQKIQKAYPDQVRIEYRHLPLPFHKGADTLSEASLCAQEQGKFWTLHDAFYADQRPKDADTLSKLVSSAGLDPEKHRQCMAEGRYKNLLQRDLAEAKARGAQGTPTYFLNGRLRVGAVSFEQLKQQIDWLLSPKGPYPVSSPLDRPLAANAPKAGLDPTKAYSFTETELKGPVRGAAGAPVTIVEFIDYHCPFCKKGTENLSQALSEFGPKIRLISKQNPLPMHANAAIASQAALCAGEQGRYWEFRERAFGEDWGKQNKEGLKEIAKKLNLKAAVFDPCLDSEKYRKTVEEDLALARNRGVSGTPTYFINGTPVVGAQPAENFKKIIEEKLKDKAP